MSKKEVIVDALKKHTQLPWQLYSNGTIGIADSLSKETYSSALRWKKLLRDKGIIKNTTSVLSDFQMKANSIQIEALIQFLPRQVIVDLLDTHTRLPWQINNNGQIGMSDALPNEVRNAGLCWINALGEQDIVRGYIKCGNDYPTSIEDAHPQIDYKRINIKLLKALVLQQHIYEPPLIDADMDIAAELISAYLAPSSVRWAGHSAGITSSAIKTKEDLSHIEEKLIHLKEFGGIGSYMISDAPKPMTVENGRLVSKAPMFKKINFDLF